MLEVLFGHPCTGQSEKFNARSRDPGQLLMGLGHRDGGAQVDELAERTRELVSEVFPLDMQSETADA